MNVLTSRFNELVNRMNAFESQVMERIGAIEQQCFGFRTSLEKLGKNNVDLHEHFTRELSDLSERLAWFEDQPVPHADEEELVPPVSPIGQNSPAHFRFDHQFARDVEPPNVGPFVPDPFGNAPRVGHGFTPSEPQVVVEPGSHHQSLKSLLSRNNHWKRNAFVSRKLLVSNFPLCQIVQAP